MILFLLKTATNSGTVSATKVQQIIIVLFFNPTAWATSSYT
ncbi:MAG: hypothetical protein R2837_10160 [Aliarcobacter sp.]